MRLDATSLAAPHRSGLRAVAPLAALVFALALALAASADERTSGPNGGQVKDTGRYHLELVVKENVLTVYVTGAKDAKVATKGASGSAIVLTGKSTVNVKLEPVGENALAGPVKFESTPDMKVVVTLTLPGQSAMQARFTPLEGARAGR